MSRELPEDVEDFTEDDIAYAKQRPWIIDRLHTQLEAEGVDLTAEDEDEDEDEEITEEMVRAMTKPQLLELFEDEGLKEALEGVDLGQNKPELIESVVAALFGKEA